MDIIQIIDTIRIGQNDTIYVVILFIIQARAQRLENAVNVQQLVASVEAGTKRRIGEVLEDTDLETEFLRYINPP
jgi:hypothetical protein